MDFRKIESLEEACEVTGSILNLEEQLMHLPEAVRKPLVDYHNLITVVTAINNGWQRDPDDPNQRGYFPVFVGSGSGFSYDSYAYDCSLSYVGARLELCSPEAVRYAATHFKHLYQAHLGR